MRKIELPEGATQHVTAGPYSPVLEITGKKIVCISGQAPISLDGKVIGNTIKEQTIKTLKNCEMQLKKANCSLNDVFKVTVYLKDLKDWPEFNEVYSSIMFKPYPTRSAVGVNLLETFLVEIEMWAVK